MRVGRRSTAYNRALQDCSVETYSSVEYVAFRHRGRRAGLPQYLTFSAELTCVLGIPYMRIVSTPSYNRPHSPRCLVFLVRCFVYCLHLRNIQPQIPGYWFLCSFGGRKELKQRLNANSARQKNNCLVISVFSCERMRVPSWPRLAAYHHPPGCSRFSCRI